MSWQPISKAPRGAKRFLAADFRTGEMWIVNWPVRHYPGRWEKTRSKHADGWDGEATIGAERATHWQPLPAPPES
jgi:hypothetical protein